jgi:hypothetical protein
LCIYLSEFLETESSFLGNKTEEADHLANASAVPQSSIFSSDDSDADFISFQRLLIDDDLLLKEMNNTKL